MDAIAGLVAGSVTVDPGEEEPLHFADWGGLLCGEESGLWTIDESVLFEGCSNPCRDCERLLWGAQEAYHFAPGFPELGLMPDPRPGAQETLCGAQAVCYYTSLADFVVMPVKKCPTCVTTLVGIGVAIASAKGAL